MFLYFLNFSKFLISGSSVKIYKHISLSSFTNLSNTLIYSSSLIYLPVNLFPPSGGLCILSLPTSPLIK